MSSQNPFEPPKDDSATGRSLWQRLELNRAVVWAILTRTWQVFAGAVSFYLIGSMLTGDEQGYYMTFWSLIAMQTLADMGFTIAILNFSSHEWSDLSLDESGAITGDENAQSRLVSLGRIAFAWFGIATVLFVVIAGFSGHVIFASDAGGVPWKSAWWILVAISGGSLWMMPFLSLLEGAGQLEAVYRFRFWQALLTNVVVWTCLWSGLGLWTAVGAGGIRLLSELWLLGIRYREFFRPFFRSPNLETVNWRRDIWPMQWRLSVGGVFNYFAVFLFSPIMFHFHSPQLAGQMGMTRQLLMTLQGASQSWIQSRVPEFGHLIAKRDFGKLDQLFRRVTLVSLGVLAFGGIGYLVFVFGLNMYVPKLATRVLGPWPTLVMLFAFIAFQLPYCQTLYLRAHKREPVMWATVASNVSIALAVFVLGWRFAAIGAAWGHFLPVLFVTVPLIHRVWVKCRVEWHS